MCIRDRLELLENQENERLYQYIIITQCNALAGVLPGLVMGAALIAVTFWLGRKKELTRLPKASGKERWKAFKDAFWGLLMPVIILGGIYGGVFTPTEAAAVSVVYGLVGGVLRADGAIVGFTLGEVLRDTLYIHIEKADRDYPGAYQMLCRQFCTAYADGLAYVNREEDMGDLGLRKAKRDLHPVTQLKKYTVEVW